LQSRGGRKICRFRKLKVRHKKLVVTVPQLHIEQHEVARDLVSLTIRKFQEFIRINDIEEQV
jgi:hypothetical protein